MKLLKKTVFTSHVLPYIKAGGNDARLLLSGEEIARLLDNDLAVSIGFEPRDKEKLHRLFYSAPDDDYFVAVQSIETGEVITILPFRWHVRFAVSYAARVEAKRLAAPESCGDMPCIVSKLREPGMFCEISAMLYDGKVKTICYVAADDSHEIYRIKNDIALHRVIREAIADIETGDCRVEFISAQMVEARWKDCQEMALRPLGRLHTIRMKEIYFGIGRKVTEG